jgi:pimeloyl-ACP methyl ester carboxylesterase
VATGSKVLGVIPRDLRNAVLEVSGHGAQMPSVREALLSVRAPIHLIHGDQDDFAPIDTARRVANEMATRVPIRFTSVPGANHFLNDGPTETLLGALEACMPAPALRRQAWRLPSLPDFLKPAGGLGSATAGA